MALLSIKKTFDSTITIGEFSLPIHVARLNRSQLAEVEDGWNLLCVPPRGSNDDAREAWNTEIKDKQYQYLQDVIEKHVTLDAGLIDIDGVDVTDGEGLVRVFHSRLDVLGDLVTAVRIENRLAPTLAKNSKSPSASATGSAPSTQEGQVAAGSTPARTATNADSSTSAPAVDATAERSEDSGAALKSSRSSAAGEPVH